MSAGPVYVANLVEELSKRLKVALTDESQKALTDQVLEQYVNADLLACLLIEQRITNRYLAEMLGDKIEEDDL